MLFKCYTNLHHGEFPGGNCTHDKLLHLGHQSFGLSAILLNSTTSTIISSTGAINVPIACVCHAYMHTW
jgi:hypothetical protein